METSPDYEEESQIDNVQMSELSESDKTYDLNKLDLLKQESADQSTMKLRDSLSDNDFIDNNINNNVNLPASSLENRKEIDETDIKKNSTGPDKKSSISSEALRNVDKVDVLKENSHIISGNLSSLASELTEEEMKDVEEMGVKKKMVNGKKEKEKDDEDEEEEEEEELEGDVLLTTVVTATSRISGSEFDYDLMKPYESDPEDGKSLVQEGENEKKEEKVKSTETPLFHNVELIIDDVEEDTSDGLGEERRNASTENEKREINNAKTSRYIEEYEEEEEEDEDDDEIVVLDKPPSGVMLKQVPQTVEVLLEGIAEEPEDVKDEECDSVIIREEEEDEDEESARKKDESRDNSIKSFVIKERVFEEEEEEEEGDEQDKENVCDAETLNESLEVKSNHEEDKSKVSEALQQPLHPQQVPKQQAKEQLQQQIEEQLQQQIDSHEYVNVKQFSPKLQTHTFDEELTKTFEEQSDKEKPIQHIDIIVEKDKKLVDITENVGEIETSVDQEASRAVLNEEDFNFELESDDYKTIHKVIHSKEEEDNIKRIRKKYIEKEEETSEEYENISGEGYTKRETDEAKGKKTDDVLVEEISKEEKVGNGFILKADEYEVKTEKQKTENKEKPESFNLVDDVFDEDFASKATSMPTTKTTTSETVNQHKETHKIDTGDKLSSNFSLITTTTSTTTAKMTTTTRNRSAIRTPTTPSTPIATSYIRHHDILPEAGSVKALVEQWSRRWSRMDGRNGDDDKGMNRSRSCGPISRKLKLMSPERELDEEVMGGRKMGERSANESDGHYTSQPSLTRNLLNKFEKMDQDAAKNTLKKKTFKWEVKEAKILK